MDDIATKSGPGVMAGSLRRGLARIPTKARFMLGFFMLAAVLMALHTALSSKDATLHLAMEHEFRSGDVSIWIDGKLVYATSLTAVSRKKFGMIPESPHGSVSEQLPVFSGPHQIRVQVVGERNSVQENNIIGVFAPNTERELFVSARRNGLSLAWRRTTTKAPSPSAGYGWFTRYAGTLALTVAGSIISALTGFAIRELPASIRAGQNDNPTTEVTAPVNFK